VVKREQRCHWRRLWRGAGWAISWVLTAGVLLVFAYRAREGVIGVWTIFLWVPVIVSYGVVFLLDVLMLVAQRGSPSFRKGLGRLVAEVVHGGTAVGAAAALVFAAPPLPGLESFATGVGGAALLAFVGAIVGAMFVASVVWGWIRIRRTKALREGGTVE